MPPNTPQATSTSAPLSSVTAAKGSDAAQPERSAFTAPAITQPRGGGAIRGIDEKFSANPATGTGTLTVPLGLSPGRAGFGPQLALTYDSGAGNGEFGQGWSLAQPSISRRTDKGLPTYDDDDVFLLSGAEDLVPVLDAQNERYEDTDPTGDYTIHRYRPRIEGLFARIERWTHTSGKTHWRSITRDNITTWYGRDDDSRIFDPAEPTRIFRWLICSSYDDKGNAIVYEYVRDDPRGVDRSLAHEANRRDAARETNRYLRRIKYGNLTPNRDNSWNAIDPATLTSWMFEVLFDFEDVQYRELPLDLTVAEAEQHRYVSAANTDGPAWLVRPDPWSDSRATFEVRTYRRCRRILQFHDFPSLPIRPCLVRSTEIDYDDFDYTQVYTPAQESAHPGSTRTRSVIRRITQSGFVHAPTSTEPLRYLKKSLPPVELEYTDASIDATVLDVAGIENLPAGVDGTAFQWLDLDGEGLSGALAQQGGTWFYKRNVSALPEQGGAAIAKARFEPLERVGSVPPAAAMASANTQFLDLAGDGQVDVVELDGPTPGFYERTAEGDWEPFLPFDSLPTLAWTDPNLRMVDLTGDGHADVLITEDEVFTWYQSLGEQGFAHSQRVAHALDEEEGPRLVFADGTQSIYLADMSGDGLTDLVRVSNGEVCYWPSLGHCRWGRKVAMDNAPWFDAPDCFDQRRVRLADIDGTGSTDIIYLGAQQIDIYRNQCGNRWTNRESLADAPLVDSLSNVNVLDLLGNGTACIVWSSPLEADARQPMHYIDLMGGEKPHLLVKMSNNMGAETRVRYAPSTRFYLQDRRDGKPWITRLPFPVHVIERIETYDHVSRNRFVSRYAYHHGFYDGVEREFRGFGMVEQFDTLEIAALAGDMSAPIASNISAESHVPPVVSRTWFHTGVYLGGDRVSNFFAGLLDANDRGEYYREPGLDDLAAQRRLLDDTPLPGNLSFEEQREACRTLKGSMLRHEVYALDGTGDDEYPYGHPYVVTEQNFGVVCVQGKHANRNAVFFAHPREALTFHYERNPADPRVTHEMTLAVDPKYGQVRKSLSIAYGRRAGMTPLLGDDKSTQERTLLTYTDSDFTNPLDDAAWPDDYRVPAPSEIRTYEVTGFEVTPGEIRFDYDRFADNDAVTLTSLNDTAYEAGANYGQQRKRLIEQVRTLYRPDDLGVAANDALALLPRNTLERLALPGEIYRLAFTSAMLDAAYTRAGQRLLPTNVGTVLVGAGGDAGGYVQLDGKWWLPSGRVFYAPPALASASQERTFARQHFFIARRFRDPFHHANGSWNTESHVEYDNFDLLVRETRDALGNRMTVGTRKLDDTLDVDGNDYRVLQPRLVMDPNRNCAEIAFDALGLVVATAAMGKPEDTPAKGDRINGFATDLTQAQVSSYYDASDPHVPAPALLGDASTRIVYDVERFQRSRAAHPLDPSQWVPVFAATLARETHVSDGPGPSKIQLSFSYSDGFGRVIQQQVQAEQGQWIVSGWTVFNNKGSPVLKFEPFFSNTHRPDFDVRVGVSAVLFYDPLERAIATLQPNQTYEKVVFDPWSQSSYDVNDTVALDPSTDPDVRELVTRYLDAQPAPWATWLSQRIDPANPPLDTNGVDPEQDVAVRALAHAGTPTVTHFDSLGRTFLTIADNGLDAASTPRLYRSLVKLDIEGNEREVIDARDRTVMRYAYDMLGNRIRQSSMDGGEHWTLYDAVGKPLRLWDGRGHNLTTTYDRLRRAIAQAVFGTDAAQSDSRTLTGPIVFVKTEYGESQLAAETLNLRTRMFRQYDAAGILTNATLDPATGRLEAYDFKGNLLCANRQVAPGYTGILDWTTATGLPTGENFTVRTQYDALNRPISRTTPDGSVIRPTYNDMSRLETLRVTLAGATAPTAFVTNIDYDAKGRRTQIDYGTVDGAGISTSYDYDPLTFRLIGLTTRRNATPFDATDRPGEVQSLGYVHDPAGNITHVRDAAQDTIYFRNLRVEPSSDFRYDPVYQLVSARGREHLGLSAGNVRMSPTAHSYNDWSRTRLIHPNEGRALGTYQETYTYDDVGNVVDMTHAGTDPANSGWNRTYVYDETSALIGTQRSNRLTKTTVAAIDEIYSVLGSGYDAHGNMLRMPQLQTIRWDFLDRLQLSQRQKVNNEDVDGDARNGERTYYVYDATGQRVRKVTELATGAVKDERIYLGEFEVYRSYGANAVQRDTLHIMDDKQRVAMVETNRAVAGAVPLIRYQFSNHLGTACLELDRDAQVISYEEYSPYGSSTYRAARAGIDVSSKRYRYTSKERDEESGLYYHGARYYAPWLGRWTSCDPLGVEDGTNRYAYVRNNPSRLIDPSGRNGNDPQDVLKHLYYQAGFEEAQRTPQTGAQGQAVWGQRAHFRAESVHRDLVNAGVKDAERIVMAPAINKSTGVLTKVGGNPIRGHDNPDALVFPKGQVPNTGSVIAPRQGDISADFKYGSGEITTRQASYAKQGVTINADYEGGPSTGQASPAASNAPAAGPVNLTAKDADLDPKTGKVVPGPNTTAAQERRAQGAAASAKPPPPSTPKSGGGGTAVTPRLNSVGGTASTLVKGVVPGVAEAEIGLIGAAYYASQTAATAPLVTPLLTAAEAVPIVGGGLVAGGVAGNLYENAATSLGASSTVAKGTGIGGAILTGAAVGALIGSPTGIGAPIGAVIGGAAGLIGYGLSKWL